MLSLPGLLWPLRARPTRSGPRRTRIAGPVSLPILATCPGHARQPISDREVPPWRARYRETVGLLQEALVGRDLRVAGGSLDNAASWKPLVSTIGGHHVDLRRDAGSSSRGPGRLAFCGCAGFAPHSIELQWDRIGLFASPVALTSIIRNRTRAHDGPHLGLHMPLDIRLA